jgi:abortive infection bacteriophage resistance protein
MKLLLTVDELIEHMKTKGIKFSIVSESDAKKFLLENNYYMKLASYRTNYPKYETGSKQGQYINLDFAYLKELSTIDMHLRYLIMKLCLDIEHALKVSLMSHVEANPAEDGYELIRRFIGYTNPRGQQQNEYILKKIRGHKFSDYSKDLIEKYYPYFPVWVFVELISFGDLAYLIAFTMNCMLILS